MKNTTFKRNTLIGVMAVVLSLVMVFTMAVNEGSHAASPTPGKVTLTKISSSAYNKVTVSWKKTSNATHYKIYYKKSGASRWTGLKTVGSGTTSYTHTASSSKPITVGQKYVYTVKGYNSKSKKTGSYNTKGLAVATRPNTVKLGKVSLNSAKTQTTLTWSKAGGANQYLVYRKTPGTGWKKLATVGSSTTKYTDKAPVKGQTNTYTVKSYYSKTKVAGKYNSKGISIAVPKPVVVTPKPEKPPVTPKPEEPVKVSDIIVTPSSVNLKIGESVTLTATVYPGNAADKSVTWKCNSNDVTLTPNGNSCKVTAVDSGTVFVEAWANGPHTVSGIKSNATVRIDLDPAFYAKRVLEICNEIRAEEGLAPFKFNQKLEDAAMLRAKELETKFSHQRPNGENGISAGAEMGAAGVTGENIAAGYGSPESVVDGWMSSSGHRAAILDRTCTHMGVGVHKGVNGQYYWVQLFASSKNDSLEHEGTLTFDANGGTFNTFNGIEKYTVTLTYGREVYFQDVQHPVFGLLHKSDCVPEPPTRNGYTFLYWMSEYGSRVNSSAALNKIVYAKWQKN